MPLTAAAALRFHDFSVFKPDDFLAKNSLAIVEQRGRQTFGPGNLCLMSSEPRRCQRLTRLMSLSTVIVAVNAQLLRPTKLE
jgi:hypothetical protein